MQPKVGIVTVTYNGATVVEDFLTSCLRQTESNFVLYVVDNFSTDRTCALVAAQSDARIQLLRQTWNTGIAAGNNIGIRQALADGCAQVLLINNDVEFAPDLVAGLLETAEKSGAAAVCPKVRYHSDPRILWWAGGYYMPWYMYDNVNVGDGELDRGQYDQPVFVPVATTCCMLVRKAVFEQIGLMDERFFVYFDDIDFCWQMQAAGLKILHAPHLELLHKVSVSTGGLQSPFTVFHQARGRTVFVRKNHGFLLRWYCTAFLLVHTLGMFLLRRYSWLLFTRRLAGIRAAFEVSIASGEWKRAGQSAATQKCETPISA